MQTRRGRHFVYGPGLRLLTGVAWGDGVLWDELAYTRNVRRRVLRSEPLAFPTLALYLPPMTERALVAEAAPEPTEQQQQPQRARVRSQRATAGEMP